MKIIARVFGAINAIYLISAIVLIFQFSALTAIITSSIGILLFLMPVIIGAIFSMYYFIVKWKTLGVTDKVLFAIPLLNLTILILLLIGSFIAS